MEEALREEFSQNNFGVDDDSVLEQCASMCVAFGLKPEDLVSSWEVFYLNRQLDGGKVSSKLMPRFRTFLQQEQREAFRRESMGLHSYTSEHVDMIMDEADDKSFLQETPPRPFSSVKAMFNPANLDAEFASVAPKTPATGKSSWSEGPRRKPEDSPVTPFSRRTTKCTVQFTFNPELEEPCDERAVPASDDDVLRRLRPIERCAVEILGPHPKAGCRFMCDRVEDRFLALERRMKKFAESLSAGGERKASDNVAVASQEQVTVVGRICCDGEGHLNDKSVLLEGSVEYSGGQRVRLDLRNLPHFSLFPGQVLGVEGYNPSGHCLLPSRVMSSVPFSVRPDAAELEEPSPKRQETSVIQQRAADSPMVQQPISILTAAGPYTANDNLFFEPLAELLAYARRKRPRLLLLMGPFVDAEHPLIKQGLVDRTFKQIFREEVGTRIEDYCQEMGDGARVLLVPSCRDAHHDCVLPQPPFVRKGFEDRDNQISFLANPSIVRCDEVTVGCCTIDVLRHLSGEELSRVPTDVTSDRMTRLASHLVAQRSFYPLFPPPVGTVLDLSLVPEALSMCEIPDILILPSDLAPFVKVLSLPSNLPLGSEGDISGGAAAGGNPRSLCINPGRLTKGNSGGTFAETLILPTSFSSSSNSMRPHDDRSLSARSKVVIMRI